MINILTFHYLHRDSGNYKDYLTAYLLDPQERTVEALEIAVRSALLGNEFFYPEDVGLTRSLFAEEHDWHEFDRIEISGHVHEDVKANARLFDDFLGDLIRFKDLRKPSSIFCAPVIHKKPRMISMRFYISALEMRRKLHGAHAVFTAIRNPDMKVLVLSKLDWERLTTTLALDAESLGGDVAKEISASLSRVEEW